MAIQLFMEVMIQLHNNTPSHNNQTLLIVLQNFKITPCLLTQRNLLYL